MTLRDRQGELIVVVLPYAVFGLVVRDGIVVDAPPIAKWTVGKAKRDVANYYRSKGASFTKEKGKESPTL